MYCYYNDRYSWFGDNFGNLGELMSEAQNMWQTGLMFPVFQSPGPRNNDSIHGGPPR